MQIVEQLTKPDQVQYYITGLSKLVSLFKICPIMIINLSATTPN